MDSTRLELNRSRMYSSIKCLTNTHTSMRTLGYRLDTRASFTRLTYLRAWKLGTPVRVDTATGTAPIVQTGTVVLMHDARRTIRKKSAADKIGLTLCSRRST